MNDLKHGVRDKRGHWSPSKPVAGVAPFYAFPPQPLKVLKWLPEYLFPWNVFIAFTAIAYWVWLLPPLQIMKTLAPGWVLWVYFINATGTLILYGLFELRLYTQRRQESRFKYNPAFPADKANKVFWFGSQNIENIIRTFVSGVTIWTGIEVVLLWAYANGYSPWIFWADHPVWLAVLFFAVPFIQEAHFYCVHRLLHIPLLYKWIHSVHHNSINPSPWSSLSMHPVEHLLYFGVALWHLILPSHPLIMLFQIHRAGFGAIPGHVGFDKIELGGSKNKSLDTHAYSHYLHHKYFEVNYGDGIVPLDALFGTWHDGTKEGEKLMLERFKNSRRS